MNADAPESQPHILSINIEDYFQVGAFKSVISRSHWHRFESRVRRNTEAALELLEQTNNKATFFTCGWIAEHHPALLREVIGRGHEVACQSYFPTAIKDMDRASFSDDLLRSRLAVEAATGVGARGFRIGRQWIGPDDLWALECIAEAGFQYDSSLCPIGRQFSRQRESATLHRVQHEAGALWEVPVSTHSIAGWSLPIAGGNYIRQFPEWFTQRLIRQQAQSGAAPLHCYFHAWELDEEQPSISAASLIQRVRHYRNLSRMPGRIERLLRRYRFTSIADHLDLPEQQRLPDTSRTESAAVADDRHGEATGERVPLTIAVPCYNEEATLPYLKKVLNRFALTHSARYDLKFVLVDDGSIDNTWATLRNLFAGDPDYQLVQHPRNRGIAAAILTAIAHAPTELVTVIDADCTFDPEQIPEMMRHMTTDVDVVTASPLHELGEMVNVPAWRLAMSHGAACLYRMVLNHKFASYTSCFRIYRKSKVDMQPLLNNGFCGVTEILARMDLAGAKLAECPAALEVRLLGQSKINTLRTIREHVQLVARLCLYRWFGKPLYPATPHESADD